MLVQQPAGGTVTWGQLPVYWAAELLAGASVTLLKTDDDLLRLWDAPVQPPGLRWGI